MFDMNKTRICDHNVEFFRRHCLLAENMQNWKKDEFVYLLDSDVISHNYQGNWDWTHEKNNDLIFYERWWNGEIMAGNQFY